MIKLAAIDMDGTLLSSDHTISEVNRKALRLASEKGVKVVLCSGRTIHNLLEFAEDLGIDGEDDYVVGYNGAGALRIRDRKFVYENCMTGLEAKRISEICDGVDANYTIHTFYESMTPRDNPHSALESGLNNVPLYIRHPRELGDQDVVTKVLVLDDEEVLDRYAGVILDALSRDYHIVRTMPIYLEILRKNVSKFSGTMAVAELHGIEREEILAIGDAPNDLEIIRGAGIGVAMGNAQASIQKEADFVTLINDEHGVAYALNRFLDLGMEEFQKEVDHEKKQNL